MHIETIEQIVALISGHAVSEITVEQGGERVHVRRSVPPVQAGPPTHTGTGTLSSHTETASETAVTRAEPEAEPEPIVLTSPMVGLFRHLAQPVPYGGLIALHQVVGSIESMKLMNDVQAEQSGRVVEVLIEDGAPVEYGQPLFRLAAA